MKIKLKPRFEEATQAVMANAVVDDQIGKNLGDMILLYENLLLEMCIDIDINDLPANPKVLEAINKLCG